MANNWLKQIRCYNRAKKNLTIFLFETGAIYSIHAVIEAFHKMHKLGVDISSILPERLSGLISDFNKIEEQDNIWAHHSVMNKICRRVITMYLKERNITVLEISSKVYTRQKDVHKYGKDTILISLGYGHDGERVFYTIPSEP